MNPTRRSFLARLGAAIAALAMRPMLQDRDERPPTFRPAGPAQADALGLRMWRADVIESGPMTEQHIRTAIREIEVRGYDPWRYYREAQRWHLSANARRR